MACERQVLQQQALGVKAETGIWQADQQLPRAPVDSLESQAPLLLPMPFPEPKSKPLQQRGLQSDAAAGFRDSWSMKATMLFLDIWYTNAHWTWHLWVRWMLRPMSFD